MSYRGRDRNQRGGSRLPQGAPNREVHAEAPATAASGWSTTLSLPNLSQQTWVPYFATPLDFNPPVNMPADVTKLELLLDKINRRHESGEIKARVIRDVLMDFCSALTTGRLTDKVNILLMGETGHGKSSTINKLVGRQVMKTGDEGSTTTEINCVNTSASRKGVRATLSFIDTPGLMDTTVSRREENRAMFVQYCADTFRQRHENTLTELKQILKGVEGAEDILATISLQLRLDVYPNVILLVASWKSIKHDTQNDPDKFTTPVGRAIQALHSSKLFDQKRPNVIVVVTNAISEPSGSIDQKSSDYKLKWCEASSKRKAMIMEIQQKVFPGSSSWPIVFVENWGDSGRFGRYDILPNGEQTHQNLFNSMRNLFGWIDGGGNTDFLGLHALSTVISGVKPNSNATYETGTLIGRRNRTNTAIQRENLLGPDIHIATDNLNRIANAAAVDLVLHESQNDPDHPLYIMIWNAIKAGFRSITPGRCTIQ